MVHPHFHSVRAVSARKAGVAPNRRSLIFILLILSLTGGVDGRGSTDTALVNTPQAKYLMIDQHLDFYQIAGKNRIDNDQGPVYTSPPGFEIRSFDLVHDQGSLLLGILMDNGKTHLLEIYDPTQKALLLFKNMTFYRPWKIQFAEVDGDGKMEVCLGVLKESPLHPVMAKRLFIYNIDQGLQPKWRGSRLSKPLVDFFFFMNHRQETYLISTELTRDGQQCLNAYVWDQFGFTGFGDPYRLPVGQALGEGYIEAGAVMARRLLLIKDGQVEGRILREQWGGILDE